MLYYNRSKEQNKRKPMKKNKTNINDQMFRDLCIFRDRMEIAIAALFRITHSNCLRSKKIAREALKEAEQIKL